jgi:magnesium-transporting ATPase (P-type)
MSKEEEIVFDKTNGSGEDVDIEKPLVADAANAFVATNVTTGLTDAEVEAALEKYGRNDVPIIETPLWLIFLRQWVGFLPFLIGT